jgi:hypothetical protein
MGRFIRIASLDGEGCWFLDDTEVTLREVRRLKGVPVG